jgi:hypothetical protein
LLVQGRALVAIHDRTFLFGPGFCVAVGNGMILGALMWKTGLVPRRLALVGLVAGPLVLIRTVLVLFNVVDTGSAVSVVIVPEIIWEAALGFYPLIKGFRIPPAPVAEDSQLRTGTAAATTG